MLNDSHQLKLHNLLVKPVDFCFSSLYNYLAFCMVLLQFNYTMKALTGQPFRAARSGF